QDALADLRELQSFPTRRSSDLTSAALAAGITAAETRAERAMAPARNFCFIFMSSSSRFLVLVKQILCSCRNDSGLACVEYCSYQDRKSTRLNSSHVKISYAVFC